MEQLSRRQQITLCALLFFIHGTLGLLLFYSPHQLSKIVVSRLENKPIILDLRTQVADSPQQQPEEAKPQTQKTEPPPEQPYGRMKSRAGNELRPLSEEDFSQQTITAPYSDQEIPEPMTQPEKPSAPETDPDKSDNNTSDAPENQQISSSPTTTTEAVDTGLAYALKVAEPAVTITSTQNKKTATNQKPQNQQPKHPLLTLAQITQGILSHHKNASTDITQPKHTKGILSYHKNPGFDIADMEGQEGVAPSIRQLKEAHYIAKLQACLQVSFSHSKRPAVALNGKKHVYLSLALNKNGSLHELKLVRSCGSNAMDNYVLEAFKNASTSFPPLPAFWTENQWVMGWKVKVY